MWFDIITGALLVILLVLTIVGNGDITATEDRVDRLSRRMGQVESRVYATAGAINHDTLRVHSPFTGPTDVAIPLCNNDGKCCDGACIRTPLTYRPKRLDVTSQAGAGATCVTYRGNS